MARTQARTSKGRKPGDNERYTAELSSAQLVIGVCILLMFGLACFLLGMLIGRFDPSLQDNRLAAVPAAEAQPAADLDAGDRVVVKGPPPELRVPPEMGKAKPEADAPAEAEATPAAETTAEASEAVEAPAEPEKSDPPAPAKAEPVKTAQTTTPPIVAQPEKPTVDRVQIPSGTAAVKTETLLTPQASASAAPPTQAAGSRYGVQVAAFKTRSGAEKFKANIESKSSYTATLVPSSNGTLIRVIVGSYADMASAAQARDDLKSRLGISDCFPTQW